MIITTEINFTEGEEIRLGFLINILERLQVDYGKSAIVFCNGKTIETMNKIFIRCEIK
jgi:hypothetical protein